MRELPAVRAAMRTIPDFPAPGILFKDLTPVLACPELLRSVVEAIAGFGRECGAEAVAGIESRGFVVGTPVALALGLPFIPIRKAGKLPAETVRATYALEYGDAEIEMHRDAVAPGCRVLVVDDLLATGGTARAACQLVEEVGGVVAGCAFLTELTFLPGRAALEAYEVATWVRFGAGE